jgi:hypothetical protein
VSWISGARIAAPVPTPIHVDLYTDEGDAMVPMFEMGVLMFRDDMIAALEAAGVDNLDLYDAVIHDREGGREYRDYKVVNIVGAVSCADLGASKHVAHGEPIVDVDFDSLVIDEDKAGNLLMFRLAECITGIVIHEKVKLALETAGIPDLYYLPPDQWVG